jgi:hypothetical protein
MTAPVMFVSRYPIYVEKYLSEIIESKVSGSSEHRKRALELCRRIADNKEVDKTVRKKAKEVIEKGEKILGLSPAQSEVKVQEEGFFKRFIGKFFK